MEGANRRGSVFLCSKVNQNNICDTLDKKILFYIIKVNIFRGDQTDILITIKTLDGGF